MLWQSLWSLPKIDEKIVYSHPQSFYLHTLMAKSNLGFHLEFKLLHNTRLIIKTLLLW